MDRRTRVRAVTIVLVVAVVGLTVQAATAGTGSRSTAQHEAEGRTLITVQSYEWFDRNNGEAFIVNESGDVTWRFDPEGTRVFDAEYLAAGTIQLAVAEVIPDHRCPPEYRSTDRYPNHCVRNRVIEVDPETNDVVWDYSWYDAFVHWHEVHDADRLPTGETAIADMGNDRAFTVNQAGEITWEWRAEDHIGPGTDFWEEYVPDHRRNALTPSGPEDDWTHLNDIDRLPNGHFQLSVRNFDVVLEVDPESNRIVDVIGRPGRTDIMREQHNPHRIPGAGTLLVADSENNRVVEIDTDTDQRVWGYTGGFTDPLQWPRDADRLPNGHTLIVDSRHFRVVELNRSGDVVWEYSLEAERGIVYDADRLGYPEEPRNVPSGHRLEGGVSGGPLAGFLNTVEAWAGFFVPPWVGIGELATAAVALLASLALLAEAAAGVWRRRVA